MMQPARRRGTIYIFALVTSMIVTMIGLMGFKMIRAQAAVARADSQRDEAAVLAESAIHWGIHLVTLKEAWREAITSGVPIRTMNLGDGQLTTTITDADGDLNDGNADSFVITGTGTVGSATQTLEVTISYGTLLAHPALEKSITVGGNLVVDKGIMTLESGGTAVDQSTTDGQKHVPKNVVDEEDPVDIPDPVLIDNWAAIGTLVPRSLHGGEIASQTFSDVLAPYGLTPDPAGVYVIDAENQNISIRESQSVGTLVVINLGLNKLTFETSKLSYGANGGPSLIVDGDLRYVSNVMWMMQQGLIYVDGNVELDGDMVLVGKLLATGNVVVDSLVGFVTMNDHPSLVLGPPLGFTDSSGCEIVPGSWKRVVN
jgi:hypothetical protein